MNGFEMDAGNDESPSLTVRLCHMKKRPGETGFGFNLMSKRDKLCQYVGKVDPGTPAYISGLRTGDKIIEIGNKNVSKMGFKEIMDLLRKGLRIGNEMYRSDELLLLVVDQNTDDLFRLANISVSSHNSSIPIEFKSSTLTGSSSSNKINAESNRQADAHAKKLARLEPYPRPGSYSSSMSSSSSSGLPIETTVKHRRMGDAVDTDDLVDEISININLSNENFYSNSSFNSSSTSHDDVELVTFV